MEPVFKEIIWGGICLKDVFGYDIPSNRTGECWVISAHKNGDCCTAGGTWKGQSLSSLWESHPEWFRAAAGCHREFPLLVKIIDARNDLSIQAHPNNAYATEHENGSLGETGCWYILDYNPDAAIMIGHHAGNKDEVRWMIEEKRWKDFMREIPVRKGDFFQINPGCVHAIKGGTLVLKTQQNNDITYRVYDYDRLSDGEPRQLHIKESIDVIEVPLREDQNALPAVVKEADSGGKIYLVTCAYYIADKIGTTGRYTESFGDSFANVSILDGEGSVNGIPISKGQRFIVPVGFGDVIFEGALSMICSQAAQMGILESGCGIFTVSFL